MSVDGQAAFGALREMRQYPGQIKEHVGWVRGTKSVKEKWGSYLWTLENRIVFKSSATNWYQSSSNGIPVAISNVLVGSLGDYGPMAENVEDIGPSLVLATNNFPGANTGEDRSFHADYTNVYYQLIIPSIWITPRLTCVVVGGSNVQYTVAGTNIPQGVTWTISPTNFTGHAAFYMSTSNSASVTPGTVATNYKVRATSKDNTNFYDEVSLAVVGLQSPLQYKIGTNTWANMPDPLYVGKDMVVDFKAIKVPTNAAWPSGKPVWGGVVSGSGVDSNSYTFSTISTSATDYKIVSAECGNVVSGRVIVAEMELKAVEFTSDHAALINHIGAYSVSTGTVYDPRGWRKDPEANNPISHVKNCGVGVNVTVCVKPSGVSYHVVGINSNTYLTFSVSNKVSNGTNQTWAITSQGNLPLAVSNMTETVDWRVKLDESMNVSESIEHHIYMTWASNLGPGPTRVRVARVCDTASGMTNEEQIADAIWNDVAENTIFGNGHNTGWELFDSAYTSGYCNDQAACMEVAVEMAGAGPADVQLVYASTNSGAGNCINMDARTVSNQVQYLIFDFQTNGPTHDWNAFEGCCTVADRYYAITPCLKTTNDYQMLQALPCRQYWIAMSNNVVPGSCSNWVELINAVIEEVPKP